MKIKDKTILITGSSSGIGRETAIKAAGKGATVILAARRLDRLKEVSRSIQAAGYAEPLIYECDVTNESDRKKLTEYIESKVGSLHILINNAGITAHGRFEETELSVFRQAMEVNFFATVDLTRRLLPVMKRTVGSKTIVYVSTPSSLYGIPRRAAYSASKAAGNMIMDVIRMEHAADNIRTLSFCPGYTETELRSSGLAADGTVISEKQAKGAKSAQHVSSLLIRAIEKELKIAFTDTNGRGVYWLRTLAPGFLEKMIMKKM